MHVLCVGGGDYGVILSRQRRKEVGQELIPN